ncbi:unnamed protein product [Brassica oleracea]
MCHPSQTPHLTMSSARIDPPKRVLGLKEGTFTPPQIHGVNAIASDPISAQLAAETPPSRDRPIRDPIGSLSLSKGGPVLNLLQTKANNELLMKNSEARPVGSAPSPEANEVEKKNPNECNYIQNDKRSHGRGRGGYMNRDNYSNGRDRHLAGRKETTITVVVVPIPSSFAPIPKSDERFARQYRCRPPPEFSLASPRSGIVHHLSGPDRHSHTRTLLRRSRSVGCAPFRDPANQLPYALWVYSPVDSHTCQTPWSVFLDGSNGEPTGRRPKHADAEARREARAADHD